MNTTIEEVIESYINGNISWAKKEAKKNYTTHELSEAFQDYAGYSKTKALLSAMHLTGQDCWQEACDAE